MPRTKTPLDHPLVASMAPSDADRSTEDKKEPTYPVAVRVDGIIFRALDKLSHEHFETKSDCVRKILLVGLEHFVTDDEAIQAKAILHELERSVTEENRERGIFNKLYDQIRQQIDALLRTNADGAGDDARTSLQSHVRQLMRLPDTVWRNQLVEHLKADFPALLREPVPARLYRRVKVATHLDLDALGVQERRQMRRAKLKKGRNVKRFRVSAKKR